LIVARNIDWEAIRADYEAGATQSELSRKHGVSRKAIQKHIEAEGWSQDLEPTIQRKVAEKVAGVVAGCDPKKKAEAIDAEASRRADVVQRHRDEWEEHKNLVDKAIGTKDFDTAKLAKITAETLKIRQEAERKAWAIDAQAAPVTNITVSQISGPPATLDEIKDVLKENAENPKV
jgi:uncharacterized coiled-coil DUF342 family protein